MQLADYQQELVDFIYDWLINEDENNGVNIYGSVGSGKSTMETPHNVQRVKEVV